MMCAHRSILLGYRIAAEWQFSALLISLHSTQLTSYIFLSTAKFKCKALTGKFDFDDWKNIFLVKCKPNMSLQGPVLSMQDVLAETKDIHSSIYYQDEELCNFCVLNCICSIAWEDY